MLEPPAHVQAQFSLPSQVLKFTFTYTFFFFFLGLSGDAMHPQGDILEVHTSGSPPPADSGTRAENDFVSAVHFYLCVFIQRRVYMLVFCYLKKKKVKKGAAP